MVAARTSGYRTGLVDTATGQISREIFVNDEIYQEELERVFTRAWLNKIIGIKTFWPEQRFSPLAQITADNANQLGLAWYADFDTDRGQEATPLVIDGVMYVSTAWSMVRAFDAKTGRPLWLYDPKVPRVLGVKGCCDVVNRGVAAWKGSAAERAGDAVGRTDDAARRSAVRTGSLRPRSPEKTDASSVCAPKCVGIRTGSHIRGASALPRAGSHASGRTGNRPRI
jgi:outer membrane protein assembly factor BamB